MFTPEPIIVTRHADRHHGARARAFAVLAAATACVVVAAGCHASYPAGPTSVTVTLEMAYGSPTPASLPVGSGVRFQIYTVTDGGYEDVTLKATWSSTAPDVLARQPLAGQFSAVAPGSALAVATYGGLVTTVAVPVQPRDLAVPRLNLTVTAPWIGGSSSATATYHTDASVSTVTRESAWESSDPTVATVDASGRITGWRVGTAQLTATYAGVSDSYQVSVPPRTIF